MTRRNMRAREPDRGRLRRARRGQAGVRGLRRRPGRPTVVLLPTWQIVHSRHWKAQVPYLARHFRVVTFDGRGSGRSARPAGAAAYTDLEFAADVVAVLDATATDRAVLVALSCGATWAVHAAADHPDRVDGIVAIAPSCGLDVAVPDREAYAWDGVLRHRPRAGPSTTGATGWRAATTTSSEFFFGRMFSEPHSTKQIEDCVGWGHEIEPATLVDATAGRLGCDGAVCASVEEACGRVRCPVLVVHGDDDRIRPDTRRRAAGRADRRLVRVARRQRARPARPRPGAGQRADPRLRRAGAPAAGPVASTWTRAAAPSPAGAVPVVPHRPRPRPARRRASPRRCARHHPDLQIDWLAQDPVTRVLEDAGETVHPASAWLASETAHIEPRPASTTCTRSRRSGAWTRSWSTTSCVFHDVVEDDALRPGHRRRGLGRRLLPAREPRAQAVRLRVDDRLRRLAADARRRRRTRRR